MLSVTIIFTSCLGDDDVQTTYPSDAAISGFTLGTLKRTFTTKSSTGADSTYNGVYTANAYKFFIDQINHQIYNPDSLPYGTDVAHVVCNITSRNSGIITIKSLTSDSLFYYNSSDSIDFTSPRTLVVRSLDGRCTATYTATINVHKEKESTFKWTRMHDQLPFANAQQLKAFAHNDRIIVFASEGGECNVHSCEMGDDPQWATSVNSTALPAEACRNAVVMGEYIYTLAGGYIMRTTTGSVWEQSIPVPVTQLVAADTNTLYALSPDRTLMYSTDGGYNWTPDLLDSGTELLPTSELSTCLIPSRINPSISSIVLVGNRSVSEFDADLRAHVWTKLTGDSHNEPWMYVNTDQIEFALPRLSSLTAVPFGGGLIAAGGLGLGDCNVPGFSHFYYSGDGGIYWTASDKYTMPEGIECNNVFTMTADDEGYLWLICGGSGQVWRGKMVGIDPERPYVITE